MKMKKLFSIIFIALVYSQSFAYNILQVVVETEEVPPIPNLEGNVETYGGGIGTMPDSTPINFIVPFLLISAIFIMFYIFKKKRIKSI
jgi:hypothetical protein